MLRQNVEDAVITDLSDLFDPGASSVETREFNARLEADLAERPAMNTLPPAVVRQARAEGKGALPLGGPLEGSHWQDIPGAEGGPGRVRISEPEGVPRGIYLHIHGGGWTIGSAQEYDKTNQAFAEATGMRVVSAAYRLAPEHPWPAQRLDTVAAARWVLETTDLPVIIGGESAGGHLAAVTSIKLRDAGLGDRVKGLLLNYGVFDVRGTPSALNWGPRVLVLSTPIMQWFYDFVDPDGSARHGPDLSPVLARLEGLPPALFQVGTEDPLLDDTLFMAARWQAAGNVTRLAVAPGGVHGFDMFDELKIAHDAREKARAFVETCLTA
ncbi:MAG: alpha/beta hydrolase [Pseudomonadota bacterium]